MAKAGGRMSPRMPVYYKFRSLQVPYRASDRRPILKHTPVSVYALTDVTFHGMTTTHAHKVNPDFRGYFYNLEVVA